MTHTKKKLQAAKKPSVVDSAWNAFFEARRNEGADPEQLAAEGWKSIKEIAQISGLPEPTVRTLIRREKFETMRVKVLTSGVRRITVFARPN
jgi:ABC-type taurine transport system substrate-binding protein